MSGYLGSIPPLIPPPNLPQTHTKPTSLLDETEDDDRFATLFSPPTPPASRSLTPIRTEPQTRSANTTDLFGAPSPSTRRPRLSISHSRGPSSADSDFGTFVSVPASEDPLHPAAPPPSASHSSPMNSQRSSGSGFAAEPLTPIQNLDIDLDFFERFTDEAKAATEKNRRSFVDELLAHEDDPMYFFNGGQKKDVSRSTTPSPRPQEITTVREANLLDLSPATPYHDLTKHRPSPSRHPSRLQNLTAPSPSVSLSSPFPPPAGELSSTPPSPSSPRRSRTSTLPSIPTKWISSLISSPRASTFTPTPSEEINQPALSYHPPPTPRKAESDSFPQPHSHDVPPNHQSTLPIVSNHPSTPSHSHSFSISESLPNPPSSHFTHHTPFAAHHFTPASGAPGFAGEQGWQKAGFDDKEVAKEVKGVKGNVRLIGRKAMTAPVLTQEVANMIRPQLPALPRLSRSWSLLYSLDQHGISLKTLYKRCEANLGGALVVVRDSGEAVFGAWVGEGVHMSKGSYYGGGESFLWRARDDRLQVYRWAGKNDYVALCEPEYISFGGGDGHYGLYLDDTLYDGSSAYCPTFANEPLCSSGPKKGGNVAFECVGLEVWAMGSS